jgi:hypothetical protein
VLYLSRGLISQPEFEPARELHIEKMWDWTGKSWGGLPDGTSLVNPRLSRSDLRRSLAKDKAAKEVLEKDLSAVRLRVIAAGRATPSTVDAAIYDMSVDDFLVFRESLEKVSRVHFRPKA